MEKSQTDGSEKESSQIKDSNFGSSSHSDKYSDEPMDEYSSESAYKDCNSQGLLGCWNHFYSSFSKKVVDIGPEYKENTSDNFTLDTIFKKVKRSENVFTKIKRFYRSLTEDDYLTESDHSEPGEVVLESKLNEEMEKYIREKELDDNNFNNKKQENEEREQKGKKERHKEEKDNEKKEIKDNEKEKKENEKSENHSSKESENDLLASFSSLSVKIRNDELDKMHDVLKRYRDKETRLTEKLMKNEYKVQEYDYFPKLGEKDHDLWDLKTKLVEDDTMEYLKILFFRDSEPEPLGYVRYDLRDIQESLDRVRESDGILVDKFGIEINTSNISCLMDTNWLNDEIINFYLQILQEQSDLMRTEHELPSCYFFNTFFFQALCGNDVPGVFYDYKSVARWTKRKKVNIFEKDLLIVPVHVSKVHWALGVVDMRTKWRRIMIFDSLGGTNPTWFKNIKRWLQDEHMDKMNKKLTHIDEWKVPKNYSSEPYAPSQKNSYDCGLFLCQFAKCISFAKGFDFTNESSSYLRNMMIHEILSCKVEV